MSTSHFNSVLLQYCVFYLIGIFNGWNDAVTGLIVMVTY